VKRKQAQHRNAIAVCAVILASCFWLTSHATAEPTATPVKSNRPNQSISTVNQSGGQNIIAGGDVHLGPQPRHLDRAKFVAFLKECKSGPFEIRCSATDVEARNFALEIQGAFWEAGWKEARLNDRVLFFPQPTGLKLWIKSAEEEAIPPHAGAVQQAFKHINLPTAAETHEDQEKGTLILVVGSIP
jgi:hypothetical protein